MRWYVALFLGFVSGLALEHLILSEVLKVGEALNVLVLSITGYIVWRYTVEAQRSNEIQEKPLLDLYLEKVEMGANTEKNFIVKNVGAGPAHNIRFEFIETRGGYSYAAFIDEHANRLEVGADRQVHFFVRTPSGGTEVYSSILGIEFFMSRLFGVGNGAVRANEMQSKTTAIFVVTYMGVNGKKYYSILRFYPSLPFDLTGDIILQFISHGEGNMSMRRAKEICSQHPLSIGVVERSSMAPEKRGE